ncbi:MAG: FtsX-like permease family protein [Simkaniaceae bacterium]|nr:FtsX-like permease family protein [Simkaniaceae bacterium]
MLFFAVKMLIGDRAKYIGIIIGLSFASFIITQQAGIFIGLMIRTYGFITDTPQATIWVMEKNVQQIDDVKPMKSTELYRIKSVDGVEWAVPLYKGLIRARLANGTFQTCNVLGIDDATLIGGPPIMTEGSLIDLRITDAIIVNEVGADYRLASPSGDPLRVGDVLELNDHRASVVGKCETTRTFQSQPVIYTTYDRAINYAPPERKMLSYVLAHEEEGQNIHEVCRRIEKATGLAAYTSEEFKQLTVNYYLEQTGIPINFGVAVALGFVIGTVIAGMTFYSFTLDNLHYFGTYKAMGATNELLARMILLQAMIVGCIGWGIGSGAAALFGFMTRHSELSFNLPWPLFLLSAVSLLSIVSFAAVLSMIKIFRLDPAIVFRS